MDPQTRTQVILAATQAAGPEGDDASAWSAKVAEMATKITVMLSERSEVSRAIEQVESSKTFVATVLGITKEASSTRGLIKIKARPSERHPDGIESVRTERTDSPAGLAMARRVRALVGHRVALWVEVESVAGSTDKKVRVLRHIEDLGPVEGAAPAKAARPEPQPQPVGA